MSHGGPLSDAEGGHGTAEGSQNIFGRTARGLGQILPLGYLLVSAVGIVFESMLLGPSFLTYAEPEDFLMAGLRHPIVPIFVVASTLLAFLLTGLNQRLRSRFPRFSRWDDRLSWLPGRYQARKDSYQRRVGVPIFVIVYFYIFTDYYANHIKEEILHSEEPPTVLQFIHPGDAAAVPSIEGHVVATTGGYIFFWEKQDQKMHVIPIGAVRQMLLPEKLKVQ